MKDIIIEETEKFEYEIKEMHEKKKKNGKEIKHNLKMRDSLDAKQKKIQKDIAELKKKNVPLLLYSPKLNYKNRKEALEKITYISNETIKRAMELWEDIAIEFGYPDNNINIFTRKIKYGK